MIRRLVALAAIVLAAAVAPFAHGSTGSGIVDLRLPDQIWDISADGSRVAYNAYDGSTCDKITVWSPATGERLRVRAENDCDYFSTATTLAGTRVLWQDGSSANTYTDFVVLTADAATRPQPATLYTYEYTHDDQNNREYGTIAGPFAGKGSLLVFQTAYEHVKGPDTNAKLWRVDGRRITLIRRGSEFSYLSVDRGRIAATLPGGAVFLLDAHGTRLPTLRSGLKAIDGVTLQGNDLAAAGDHEIVVLDVRTGRMKLRRALPRHAMFEDYAEGLAALVEITSVHVLRLSDGKDVRVARPRGPDLQGQLVQPQIEPAGLFYAYSNRAAGHVVFVPRKSLEQLLH